MDGGSVKPDSKKYVLVTGGSGGIGNAVVELFAEKGYGVFSCDVKPFDRAREGVTDIVLDVTDMKSVSAAVERVSAQTDRLFAVINCAGILAMDSLIEMSAEKYELLFNVNVFGAFRINQAFFPLYRQGGRVVLITSELAPLDPLPFNGIYGITKAALDKYAVSLAQELNLLGVPVIIFRPGAVDTGMVGLTDTQMNSLVSSSKLYRANAKKLKRIIDSQKGGAITPRRLAELIARAVESKKPKAVYCINGNFKLKLLSALPLKCQYKLIKRLIK